MDIPKSVIDTLIAEAYGEGPEGMRRVAETILNRAAVRGLSVEQVVKQPSQYTGYWSPGPSAQKAMKDPKVRSAAEAAFRLAMEPGDPTGGADHYFNPNIVNPSWAGSMTPKGQYRNHAFYSSRPIPPGEIPNVVASLTDTVPPAPPVPVAMSPDLALMRNPRMSSSAREAQVTQAPYPQPPLARRAPQVPTADLALSGTPRDITPILAPGNSDIYSYWIDGQTPTTVQRGLGSLTPDAVATTPPNRPPRGIPSSSTPFAAQDNARSTRPFPRPLTERPRTASFAGQDGAPASRQPFPLASTARPRTGSYARQEAVSPPARQAAPQPANMSPHLAAHRARDLALQDELWRRYPARLPELPPSAPRIAPTPARQSLDLEIARRPGSTVATVPTNPNIGRPPVERVVQSVPVRTTPTTQRTVPANLPVNLRSRDAAEQAMRGTQTAAMFGTTSPGREVPRLPATPNSTGYGAGVVKQDDIALAPGFAIPDLSPNQPPRVASINVGGVPTVAPVGQTAVAPVPLPASARPIGVGTQLDTTPPAMRNVNLPRQRPNRPAVASRTPPLRITVNGANLIPPRLTPLQMLQAAGLTPAQAYALASSGGYRPSLEDRVTGAGTQASSGASAYSISG